MERVLPGEADLERDVGEDVAARAAVGWVERGPVPALEAIASVRRAAQQRLISQACPAISSSVPTVERPW
jgi:hypothetical protein